MSLAGVSLLMSFLAQPQAFSLDGVQVRVLNTGAMEISGEGIEPAALGLVLWYGDWKYVSQAGVRNAVLTPTDAGGELRGDMQDADGKPVLSLQQSFARTDEGLTVTYSLARAADVEIRRGPLLELRLPRDAYAGRRQLVAPGAASRIPARVAAGGAEYWLEIAPGRALVLRLSEPAGFAMGLEGASYLVRPTVAPSDFDQHSFTLTLSSRPMPARLSGEVTGDDRPLALGGVEPAAATVPRHGVFKARLDLSATYDNPFDPDQVALDAHFTAPSGREIILPCFYALDFERTVTGDVETLVPADSGSWRLRFTPEEVGRYSFRVTARDGSGEVTWQGGELTVEASDLPGFVRVSPSSPRYLALSTGQPLFPIGHNLPTYHVSSFLPDRELAKMHAGGENYNRWWMYSTELGLEFEHALGWYRQPSAWRMDFVLHLAEELGFWYMLCLDTHQDFRGTQGWEGWPNNLYNAALGGPCQTPAEFFTSAEAKAQYRKRLRYLVARYGWSTRVLCWEFGNEFEGWPDTPPEDLLAWHREMSDYLRELDPYRHLITTSFWTPAGRPDVWNLPNLDIVQTHHYANAPVDMARMVAADCRGKYDGYRKPHIYGEIGLDSRLRLESSDPQGFYLHNSIWAALMSGAASAAMSWWHESYIDKQDLYGIYRGLSEFVRDVPLQRYEWRPVEIAASEWTEPPGIPLADFTLTPAYGWGKPTVERFEVSPLGEVNDADQIPTLLQGQGHRDLQQPVSFVVTYPEPGRFVVHVDRVSNSGLLRVFLDGEQAAEFDLRCAEGLGKESVWREQWKLWETTYDEDVGVEVPAGRHEIRIENDGRDWVRVAAYRFIGARGFDIPDHLVLGLRSPDMILLWVRNDDFTWFNAVEGKVRRRPPCRLVLGDVAAGTYVVERWDTWEGRVVDTGEVQAQEQRIVLDVPELERDTAFRLIRKEAGE